MLDNRWEDFIARPLDPGELETGYETYLFRPTGPGGLIESDPSRRFRATPRTFGQCSGDFSGSPTGRLIRVKPRLSIRPSA
jgi:hypothetical protein